MKSQQNWQTWISSSALFLCIGLLLSACGGGGSGSSDASEPPIESTPPSGWELVWSDEFEGESLDTGDWNIQVGDGTAQGIPGWGNNELQSYQPENVAVSGGHLIISARRQSAGGREYTSGRINTADKVDVRYGRIEASIQAPSGKGLWSAFWMLPTNSPYRGWAAGGEIDIMEVYSRQPAPFTQGVVHYGMAWPLNVFRYKRYDEIDPAGGFHTYAVEWDAEEIRWFVDGRHFHTITNATYWTYYKDEETNAHRSGSNSAPFDQPFHLLLNLAVGGNLPGDPVPEALPSEMRVDYVRVYQCNRDLDSGLGCDGLIDPVDPAIEPAAPDQVYVAEYDLYGDQAGPLAFPDVDAVVPLSISLYDNNGALSLSEVQAEDEHQVVIEVITSGGGNFSIHATDLSRQNLFGMGDAGHSGKFAGELKFDLYVFSEGTDPDGSLQVKLDSGFPDLGFVEMPLSDFAKDEWTPVTVQISDIVHNPSNFGGGPVNMRRVLSLFVLELSSSAHLRIDNIKLLCGHPQPAGCGITPPAPPTPDATEPFGVFIDAVDPAWDLGIRGADSGSDWAAYGDSANPSNKSRWRQVSSSDPSRGQILEVDFLGGSEFGVWYIESSAGIDLSAYAKGRVNFDIRVESYSQDASGMTMKIDCVFPCTSGDQRIGRVAEGIWETIQVPVSQLVDGGLDPANVNTGIVVFPTDQDVSLSFELDNIQWLPPEAGSNPSH